MKGLQWYGEWKVSAAGMNAAVPNNIKETNKISQLKKKESKK